MIVRSGLFTAEPMNDEDVMSRGNPRAVKALSLVVTILPVLVVGANIALLGLDIPFMDQWEVVPLLDRLERGTFSWPSLFAQHNEHRPVFPRLLWLSLARLTDYNTNAELWLNLGIALATFAIFLAYTSRFWRHNDIESSTRYIYIPILALLVFNTVQWESWLMGFQTVMYLGTLCVIAGFMILTNRSGWGGFVAGVLLGIVATYSMANALLYWPIGLLLILLCSAPNCRTLRAIIWGVIGSAMTVVYLHKWTTEYVSYGTIVSLSLVSYVHRILNFLGAPLLAYPPAFLWGIFSLAVLVLLAFRMKRNQSLQRVAPYWAIVLFIVGSAVAIGIGRSFGGPRLALAPRYITQTTWYWASLLVLLSATRVSRKLKNTSLVLVVFLLILSTLGGTISGYKWRYLRTLPAYRAVSSGEYVSDDQLSSISIIGPSQTRQRIETLCDYGWSACRTQD
ncbi:hypothetical protein ACFLWA_03135 [Chloroflexota bacterium]